METPACVGSPIFSDAELLDIERFVDRGGGLLWLSEYSASEWGTNIWELFHKFGIELNSDTVMASNNANQAHLLAQHFSCSDIQDHPATADISQVSYHRGCSLRLAESATPLILAPEGEVVAAVSTNGEGRVAVVGDSDWLSIPHVGNFDNLQMFLQLVEWLGGEAGRLDGKSVGAAGLQFLRDRSYPFRERGFNLDLACVADAPVLQCQPDMFEPSRLAELASTSPYTQTEAFLNDAELLFHETPREIRSAILNFKRHGNEFGGLLVRGLPVDERLPDTPRDARRAKNKEAFVSEAMLALFSRGLGDPFAYLQEKDGELWHNICPVPSKETELSSASSTILLDFHTETAFHPYMPDFIILHCLRSDHEKVARTEVSSTRHIVANIPLRYRAILFQPLFQTGIDASFGSPSGLKGNGPVLPIFYGDPYDPFMKFDLDLMVGLTQEAEDALQQIKMATNASKNYVKLVPGDLLIVDNRRSVHSRSEFTPRWDGRDRWLQRTYVSRDLAASEEFRSDRNRLFDVQFRV
ncbi:MAG: TauD/TfdA family dioxygenase [Caulobacteraceae bacterium]|nr:TauD/TfdA family dioxygenase [Caulobacteraceae bacterium]